MRAAPRGATLRSLGVRTRSLALALLESCLLGLLGSLLGLGFGYLLSVAVQAAWYGQYTLFHNRSSGH